MSPLCWAGFIFSPIKDYKRGDGNMFVSAFLFLSRVCPPAFFPFFFFDNQQIKSICYLVCFWICFHSDKNSINPNNSFAGAKASQGRGVGSKARAPLRPFLSRGAAHSPRPPWGRGQPEAQPARACPDPPESPPRGAGAQQACPFRCPPFFLAVLKVCRRAADFNCQRQNPALVLGCRGYRCMGMFPIPGTLQTLGR